MFDIDFTCKFLKMGITPRGVTIAKWARRVKCFGCFDFGADLSFCEHCRRSTQFGLTAM